MTKLTFFAVSTKAEDSESSSSDCSDNLDEDFEKLSTSESDDDAMSANERTPAKTPRM